MSTHLKDKDPELWEYILQTAEECARRGASATDFYYAIRTETLVANATVFKWIDEGLIPSYERLGPHRIVPRPSCNILATEKRYREKC